MADFAGEVAARRWRRPPTYTRGVAEEYAIGTEFSTDGE
jgi:hypothetical protein